MVYIQKRIGSGIFYTALSKYTGVVFSIIIGSVLARLLSPEEFGVVTLVTVFVTFFGLLCDFGLGSALIQNQFLNDKDIESIFSLSVFLGILLSCIFFFTAPYIAKFYNEPALLHVSKYLSLAVFLNSLLIVPRALLEKSLEFKKIGIITVCVQLFSGIVAILLAYTGFSYYSLVFQSILVGSISFIVFYSIKPIKFSYKVNLSPIKKVFRFSFFQFMFNFINYFSRNADNLLIGRYLGLELLGLYDKSYRLMLLPVQNLTHVITPVLMPILSKHQDDKYFVYSEFLKIVKILAIIGFPLSIFLYHTAPEIIYFLFGPQWSNSVPVFKLLSLTVGVQIILSSSGSIFQAVNRTDLLFYSGLLSSIIMISGICYGVFFGKSLESIGLSLIFAFGINFFQAFYILIHKALNCSFRKFLLVFLYPSLISIIIFVGLFLLSIY